MKIIMIGEAANHQGTLRASLRDPIEIVTLPREAASDAALDGVVAGEDVVVSLRFQRAGPGPAFRLLHVPGAGLDGIHLPSLAPSCAVCNVYEHEIPIAEYVLAAMLEWRIGLAAMRRSFTPETWSDLYRNRAPHGELHGRTLGILGFGRIGRAIATRARAFGMRVLALSASASDPDGLADAVLAPEGLSRLLAEADFVVIACPLTEATRGLIDADAIGRMKPDAVLINVSRAEVADEEALYRALRERRIGGAVLDVWYRYPAGSTEVVPPARRPFHALPNVLATPHSSAWTEALPRRRYAVIAENVRRLSAGEPLLNVVRPAA
ncbi:Glyoxylate/hydroxypyruvate reductase B [Methylobacterium crusticola]|uniref:Glyoxylate/hydroxypyruvate reductase B n=1 Tax=Methylobacterium crusticola TaxID=1697972 RepID=A0ABQ4QZD4_9HYPH|nr:2-hydroxyacid dehydrogenase [Methylobacterium crusticola]GJD50029.1 Glyoxylate/hydroxypyruvate reductase B [Methylobacterium crusticola]